MRKKHWKFFLDAKLKLSANFTKKHRFFLKFTFFNVSSMRNFRIERNPRRKSVGGESNTMRYYQQTPCASIASTTFSKPAIFAPTT